MPREYSNEQLERMVMGEAENPNVSFYEQSRMNPELSKAAGTRVYETVVMIKKTQPGLTDFVAYRAQPKDIKEYPDEYQYLLNTKADIGSPGIEIIPGLTQNEVQELKDYGITTITKLCDAETLPAHLQHCQVSAQRINEVFKNEQQSNEESQQEENVGEEGGITQDTRSTEVLPEACRSIDTGYVGRPSTEDSPATPDRGTAGRPLPGGRINSGERVTTAENAGHIPGRKEKVSNDWSISFG